jgi:hypothetical protein
MSVTPSTTEVTLAAGLKVKVSTQANADEDTEFVQITSDERVKLTAKEQNDIRHAIVRKQHPLYNKMDLASTNLNELVGFQTNLETTERHFAKFDLRQVFMIVEPERDANFEILSTLKPGTQPRNMFQWYAVLKVEDIVASSKWWRKYLPDPWYKENMGLTFEYLRTHTADPLWMKVNEEYNTFSADAKGGPLFLFLMINQLMADNDSIARALADKINSVKISSYKGEDVGEAVTHLRAIITRLKNMRRRDSTGNQIDLVPFDLSRRLYGVFQTSSSEEFNKLFHNRYTNEYAESLISGRTAWSDPDRILSMAGNLYVRLSSEGNWNGVGQNKATFPTFKSPKAASAFLSNVKCHNCGGPHYLRECTEPKDQARIDANTKKMEAAKKLAKKDKKDGKGNGSKSCNGHPPGGKFPQKPARGQPNKCTVEGKQYYFHFKSQRWLLVDQQSNTASAPVALTTSPTTQNATRNNSNADKSLAFSIFANQFSDAISVLESSMMGHN